jgi:putative ABC transport system permease protein
MLQDLRIGIRMLLKQPGFTLIGILTLALGIGATAAVFSLVQGVLLTPPPYRQPDRLVLLPSARADGQKTQGRGWPAAQWMEWQKEARSFESIAAYSWSFSFLIPNTGDGGGSESMQGMAVTRDYFRVLGIEPSMGRIFSETEGGPNSAPVIILGHDLWQRRFHGDPNIVGKTVRLSRRRTPVVSIIGVMPAGVRFLPSPGASEEPNYNANATVDYWIPAIPAPDRLKEADWDVAGRLRDGVAPGQALEELRAIAGREASADPAFGGFVPVVELLSDQMNRDGRRILLPLLGAAGLVLFIACGNAAALLLVRGLQRQQEYAVRIALGVSRAALFRQVAVESLLLALAGAGLGIVMALAGIKVFKTIGEHAIPRLDAVGAGWPVLGCGLGAAIFAALAAGLLPAFRATSLDPVDALKAGGPRTSAGRADRRLLRGVTMFQTALTLALLVGAGLLIQTMMNLSKVRSGYDTEHILTMSVTSVQGDWTEYHRRALDRVSAVPGITGVAFAWGVPLTGNSWPGRLDVEGQAPAAKASDRIQVPMRAVTEGYFALMRLPIVEGRDFRASDARNAAKVAVINQAFADRYFPRGNAVGKKIWPGKDSPTEVVGVIANARTAELSEPPNPEVYFPLWQWSAFSKHLVVRAAGDPGTIGGAVQRELRGIDPTVAIENIRTMEQIRVDSVATRTFAMRLLTGFSVVGSLLTLIGIYGVLSLSVAARRREIAIRSALGASESTLRNLVLAEGFRLIAGGVAGGMAAALLLSRALKSFLFGVEGADAPTLLGVGLLFAAVAMLAFWAPAARAAKADPQEALRCD